MDDRCRGHSKVYLSAYHLHAADLFASRAAEMEKLDTPYLASQQLYDYRAFVIGSVLCSVAFADSNINQLFNEASDGPSMFAYAGLPQDERSALASVWNDIVSRKPILERYDLALETLGRRRFLKDRPPYSEASAVIRLRNFLVHFPGEWMPVRGFEGPPLPQKEQHGIEKTLRGRFVTSKFSDEHSSFFPDQCLGAGCAKWACNMLLDLVREFADSMGIPHFHSLRA